MVKKIPLEEAVGLALAHDITEIRPGQFKGPAFRRGQVVREQDLEHLRRLGKEYLFVLELGPDEMHEDDAARVLARALCGPGVAPRGEPAEGKIMLVAERDGLLEVNREALLEFNLLGEVMCASRHRHVFLRRGQSVAGTRAVPLIIRREIVERATAIANGAGGVFSVLPLVRRRVGAVITGSEIQRGLVQDAAQAVLRLKVEQLGGSLEGVHICADEVGPIRDALVHLRESGAELLIACGGMSVDPDDVTRQAILLAGAREAAYGSPVLPGAMLLVAYLGDVPVVGAPACVVHESTTVLDLVLPRLMAGERLGRREIAALAHGGLCLGCESCRFPDCAFGKGF